jgi:hypothetical protein
MSSSVHGALNSLGKEVISSANLVYSKGATSRISAVSGSILFISLKSTEEEMDLLEHPEIPEST